MVRVLPVCTYFKVQNVRVGRTWGAHAAAYAVVFDSTTVRFAEERNKRKLPVHGWFGPSSMVSARVRRRFSSSLRGDECTAEDDTCTPFAVAATLFKSCAPCPVGPATPHSRRRYRYEWFTWMSRCTRRELLQGRARDDPSRRYAEGPKNKYCCRSVSPIRNHQTLHKDLSVRCFLPSHAYPLLSFRGP